MARASACWPPRSPPVSLFRSLPPPPGYPERSSCCPSSLLPFQLVVLGLGGPAVSATTLLYNVIALPAGIWRYRRAGRLSYLLIGRIAAASLPGVVAGVLLRATVVASTAAFDTLLGVLLTLLGLRMLWRGLRTVRSSGRKASPPAAPGDAADGEPDHGPQGPTREADEGAAAPLRRRLISGLAFMVGVLSGIFGIGGGTFMAPTLVTLTRRPVRMIAGATLFATFLTSLSGLATFILFGALGPGRTVLVYPYWGVGIALGLGGAIGSQLGVALQARLSEGVLTVLLAVLLLATGINFFLP